MRKVIERIEQATDLELQDIMRAIEKRYATAYPDWDVVYIAVPKDPELRRKRLENILVLLDKDLLWHAERAKKDSLG